MQYTHGTGARPIPNRLTMFRRMQGYKQKKLQGF